MLDLDRWADDPSRPRGSEAWRDLGVRVALPAVGLWLVIVGIGMLLSGPLKAFGAREIAVNEWFVAHRTATLDALTRVWTLMGTTQIVIGVCVVVAAVVWWRTRQWWYAVVLPIAVAVQAAVFIVSAPVVGRERPNTAPLDVAPPTSSYPSGHAGASTALYVTLALMAQRIGRAWLRAVVTVVLLLVPLLVAYSRLYRGMHHVTDVVAGIANGLVCVALGWYWLRRTPVPDDGSAADPADASDAVGGPR